MKARIAMGISLSFTFVLATVEAKQGSWATGYNHPWVNGPISFPSPPPPGTGPAFEAINMAVIPLPGTGGPAQPWEGHRVGQGGL